MPAPQEQSLINRFVKWILQGRAEDSDVPKDVLIRKDRSLVVWGRLVGRSGARGERLVALDPNDLLRVRPFEPIFPVDSILMPTVPAVGFTSTAARSRVRVDVVNTSGSEIATFQVFRNFDGASGSRGLVGPATPAKEGVGVRVGFFDLDPGGTISGSSSPPNSCTLHITVERYSPTGDVP